MFYVQKFQYFIVGMKRWEMTKELHKCSNIVKRNERIKKYSAKKLNDDNTNKEWQREKSHTENGSHSKH